MSIEFYGAGVDMGIHLEVDGEWRSCLLRDLAYLPDNQGAYLNKCLAQLWPWPKNSLQTLSVYGAPERLIPDLGVFFGGSFNPWHLGHRACVLALRKVYPDMAIYIMPDYNPQKVRPSFKCSWAQYQMIREQLTDIKNCYVYPGFCGQEEPNPTSKWISSFIKSPYFLMGDDTFLSIESWQSYEQVLNTLQGIFVVPRWESELHPRFLHLQNKLNQKFPHLKIEMLETHGYQHLSSAQLRRTLVSV